MRGIFGQLLLVFFVASTSCAPVLSGISGQPDQNLGGVPPVAKLSAVRRDAASVAVAISDHIARVPRAGTSASMTGGLQLHLPHGIAVQLETDLLGGIADFAVSAPTARVMWSTAVTSQLFVGGSLAASYIEGAVGVYGNDVGVSFTDNIYVYGRRRLWGFALEPAVTASLVSRGGWVEMSLTTSLALSSMRLGPICFAEEVSDGTEDRPGKYGWCLPNSRVSSLHAQPVIGGVFYFGTWLRFFVAFEGGIGSTGSTHWGEEELHDKGSADLLFAWGVQLWIDLFE